jgi:DNA topoisomerase VI subunit B
MKLERTYFEASRAGEYFDSRQLSTLTGVAPQQFASVILKESIDNALDACEMAGVAPEIDIVVVHDEHGTIHLNVSDNGPGIPPEVVRKVLDYDIKVSDKFAYRSPTRGAQGNALKSIIGIPYALGSREPVIVCARGVRHEIAPSVDPAGHVHFDYSSSPEVTQGTTISLVIPARDSSGGTTQNFDALHWMYSFAAFNPHATLCYQANDRGAKLAKTYKSTCADIKKYIPSEPTSPHWYSAESLKGLVFNHIAHARSGGRDLPLGEFVRQFAGLTSTRKAKAVTAPLVEAGFTHLSKFAEDEERVAQLLARMQAESKLPKASALGHVGEEHFQAFFENVYAEVKEYAYVRTSGTLPSGLPFTFEFALAVLEQEEEGHLYCGINFSPTFGDPLQGTALVGPKFKANGIEGFLSEGYALPKTQRTWYRTPASVAVAAHIITPAPMFLDKGKTRLDMERT